MATLDTYEQQVLRAYESGKLASVGIKAELARLKAAARATAIKDRRVNIRLSAGDLQDIQVRALEQGIPYQTAAMTRSARAAAAIRALAMHPG